MARWTSDSILRGLHHSRHCFAVDDTSPKTTVTGTVLKAGGSRELIQHISLSVECVLNTWNESAVLGGATTKFSDVFEKYNSCGIQANIRFPFEFGGK